VHTLGLPHAIAVTTAEVTDRNGALQALQRCKSTLSRVQSVLCDSRDVGQPFEQGLKEVLGEHVSAQIAKRSALHTFKVTPKRWSVERNFAWLNQNRQLCKNCERWLNTSAQFVHLAFLALVLRRSSTRSQAAAGVGTARRRRVALAKPAMPSSASSALEGSGTSAMNASRAARARSG
jgi:transposase